MLKLYITFWGFFILLSFTPALESSAQLDAERVAWNRLKDGKWDRAHRVLVKSLRKDETNLEANYVLAHWFFATGNPDFQIDSAHHYIIRSIQHYDTLSVRDKGRVLKFPIDSLILRTLKNKIDSAAFDRAKKENTEQGYIRFLTSFPAALHTNNAIELRDEVGFLEALKVNTHQSFHAYLLRYPQSHRAKEASDRYEKLLFDDRTKNKRLAGFKSFLKDYPESPYAQEAHRQVFEISTASGEPNDFFNYLKEYPDASNERLARNILFHIYTEREEAIPPIVLNDSLRHVIRLNSSFWIPFLKNNLFGFIDQTGEEMLSPQFQSVRDEYKCGPVLDDILSLPDGYYSRSGKKIANASSTLTSIGSGFLTREENHCLQLWHKSGRLIVSGCYEEYKMINDHFIAARRNGFYTLFSLAGRQLSIAGITEVEEQEGVVLLTRLGKKVLNTARQLAAMADGNPFHDELVFDEVMVVDKGLLWVRNSGLEGILDNHLNYIVPLGLQTLTKVPFGLIENQNGKIMVHGLSIELEQKSYTDIKFHRNWLVLFDNDKVQLLDIPSKRQVEADVDSVWFDRSLAFVRKDNQEKVYITATNSIELLPQSRIQFISSRDSVQFFFTENKKKQTVFTLEKGDKVLTTEFELEESIGTDYFIVRKGNKKGVLRRNGKLVVPVEMDEIMLTSKSHLSLLKDKKFGLYDLRLQKYVKPLYERNLIPLSSKNLIVYKDGFYGLMDVDTKPLTAFEFSEVRPWADSLIWVKRNFQWQLLNYINNKMVMDRVKDYTWIKNTEEEKIVKVHRENYYGVISNRKGVVIPASFNEIMNMGTVDQPFYFTEKQVEEAGIFVVVYFTKEGKLVRRQAYEEHEYERILCDDL